MAGKNISRRSFIKGATAGAFGLVGLHTLNALPLAGSAVAEETNTPQDIQWADAADVIVVGGGGSGFCAAIEAGRAGSSVLILEKGAFCGGDTALSQGMIMAAGTEEQQTIAGCADDTPERFADQQVAYAQGFAREDMIREMCMASPDHIRFMKELGRVYRKVDIIPPAWEFDTETSWGPRCHWDKDSMTGHFTLLQQETEKMTNVRCFTQKPVKRLVKRDGVGIIGVMTEDGCYYRANKGVILASGSFGSNHELAHRYHRLLYWWQDAANKMGNAPFTTPNNTGDGIRMAMEVGAGLSLCDATVISNMIETGGVGSGHINDALGIDYRNPYYSTAIPGRILINHHGKRFVQEDALWGYVNKSIYQEAIRCNWTTETEPRIWFIQDSKWAECDGTVVSAKKTNPNLAAQFKSAGTLEELAELIGVPAENLLDTVARWNAACKAGKDAEFGRRADMETIEVGPFNAYPVAPADAGSLGGVDADIDTHVLDYNGYAIPRLFAAGTVMSGTWCGQFYASCGWAILGTVHWGRKSGKVAAAMDAWTTEPVTAQATAAPVRVVGTGNYTPGVYTASAKGFAGDVPVSVEFSETAILAVNVLDNSETPAIGGSAIQLLSEQIVNAQSASLDVISGATYTSQAILAAVQDCVAQASK